MLPLWHFTHKIARDIPVGFAQVMLQPSHLVGVAFLVAVFWNDWLIALCGFLGCVAGTVTAYLLKYPEEERQEGLYGFNGTLVGLGLAYFFSPDGVLIAFVAIGGAISTVVMRLMIVKKIQPFTFPFVVTTWCLFMLITGFDLGGPSRESHSTASGFVAVDSSLRGVGQVLFQEDILTGLLLLLAVGFRNILQGVFAAAAAVYGLVAGVMLGLPMDLVSLGLYGYNGVLCAILFSGKGVSSVASALVAVTLSIAVVRLFHFAELPALTFPFVLSSWIVLWGRPKLLDR